MNVEEIGCQAAALALEQLRLGQSVTLKARGASMWPFLLDGDVLTLAPERPRLGDIVLLRQGEFGLIHRVVARVPGRLCVKGDALPRIDGWFPSTQVAARVVSVRRGAQTFTPLRWLPLPVSYLGGAWRRLR